MHRLAILLFVAGCAGTGTVVTTGSYDPDLVYISPGVSVIVDHEEPVFYNDNVYWRHYNGGWYRSTSFNRGWENAPAPAVITGIERPESYRRYRPSGYQMRHNTPARFDRGVRRPPVVRDHRR